MTTSLQQERQLVLGLQAKLPSAFTQLYDAYAPALYGTLLRLVKDQALAEDLLQDVFVKIWTTIGQYNPEQSRLFTWLLTITRNRAFDELRCQKVHAKAGNYLLHHTNDSYVLTYKNGLLSGHLTSQLAPKYRDVVELVYYQDYTKQEVADQLRLPLGTVKTRFRVGLHQLRQFLHQDIQLYHTK